MIKKQLICPDRIRMVPKQFSWVDHVLVRKKYICGLSHTAVALYLFLVTVSDAEGLSYYSDTSINRYLQLDRKTLPQARRELCRKGLIAFRSPLYQVLSLRCSSGVLPPAPCENKEIYRSNSDVVHIGELLSDCMGGVADD